MMIDRQARKLLFETVAHRVIASADELTDLDRAIGGRSRRQHAPRL